MCTARRQRDVALHMMTAPRLGEVFFRREKKEKEERGGALHMMTRGLEIFFSREFSKPVSRFLNIRNMYVRIPRTSRPL
jgi:hypothetical protein